LEQGNALKPRIALLRALASTAGRPTFWLGSIEIATWIGYDVWGFFLEGQAGALTGSRVARLLHSPHDAAAQDAIPDAQLPVEIDWFSSKIMAASANTALRRSQELRK